MQLASKLIYKVIFILFDVVILGATVSLFHKALRGATLDGCKEGMHALARNGIENENSEGQRNVNVDVRRLEQRSQQIQFTLKNKKDAQTTHTDRQREH